MIYGVGVDIVRIDRLRKSVESAGKRFLERVFTDAEVEYCHRKRDPFPSLAARFAAKEALIKAITAEEHISVKDVEIAVSENGKPFVIVAGRLDGIFREQGIGAAHLSLSHEKEYAVASVVLEKE